MKRIRPSREAGHQEGSRETRPVLHVASLSNVDPNEVFGIVSLAGVLLTDWDGDEWGDRVFLGPDAEARDDRSCSVLVRHPRLPSILSRAGARQRTGLKNGGYRNRCHAIGRLTHSSDGTFLWTLESVKTIEIEIDHSGIGEEVEWIVVDVKR
jgi:hypothetical protein